VKWLSLYIGGQKWSVHLVSPKSKHLIIDGEARFGSCDYSQCRIYIASDLDKSAREDALLHELLHALLCVSGAEAAYGKSAKLEEQLVSALSPMLHRLLQDLGFRFPRGLYE
jgi:hypothetical protein